MSDTTTSATDTSSAAAAAIAEIDALLIQNFVVYDANGRLTEAGYQGKSFNDARVAKGDRILVTEQRVNFHPDAAGLYVDLTGATPELKTRPTPTWAFDKQTVATREEATITNLPACTVSFAGPVNGTQDHDTGDLAIGFTMPGTYQISFEAWPYLPMTMTLTVAPAASTTSTTTSTQS